MPDTPCSQCNAWYNSERELRDHVGRVHRKFGSEQKGFEPVDGESEVVVEVVNKPENL
jgi:hypothetical protein